MKARTVSPSRLIAAYGLGEQKLSALSLFCDRENIKLRSVSLGEEDKTVGELCRPAEVKAVTAPAEQGRECLIFSGFDRKSLSETVDALRRADIRVTLKAVQTPSNNGWSLRALMDELVKEHEYMTSRGGAK